MLDDEFICSFPHLTAKKDGSESRPMILVSMIFLKDDCSKETIFVGSNIVGTKS